MSISEAKEQISKGLVMAAAFIMVTSATIGGAWLYGKFAVVDKHEVRLTLVEDRLSDVDGLATSVDRLNAAINKQNELMGRLDERLKAAERNGR
ncbi:MAG: hypothetical protein Q7Q73_06160 [Verrucomicrobiota bacterium JB024]|nr:hypothetical protein [Verrucomicrobiota bacterium JB024]